MVYRCDRVGNRPGGGVLVLIHNTVPHFGFTKRNFSEFCQVVTLHVEMRREHILIIVIYRSPSCSVADFDEVIQFLTNTCLEWSGHILVMGDLNFLSLTGKVK